MVFWNPSSERWVHNLQLEQRRKGGGRGAGHSLPYRQQTSPLATLGPRKGHSPTWTGPWPCQGLSSLALWNFPSTRPSLSKACPLLFTAHSWCDSINLQASRRKGRNLIIPRLGGLGAKRQWSATQDSHVKLRISGGRQVGTNSKFQPPQPDSVYD